MKNTEDTKETQYTPKLLKRWKRAECYVGAEWPEYFAFLGQHRDSDTLTRSNFICALRALGGESETVQVIRENHWAVGWVEWIAIHESNAEAVSRADALLKDLEGYSVVDEEHWSELEIAEANDVWRDCFSVRERVEYIREHRNQFEFRGLGDMLGCVRGLYFCGYASELLS